MRLEMLPSIIVSWNILFLFLFGVYMNLSQINDIRANINLPALEVNKPKKKSNNAALRAQENRETKAKRTGKGK